VINHLFEKLIDDLREKHVNLINTSEELKRAEIKHNRTIEKLEEILGEEQKYLLLHIEELYLYTNLIQAKYLYRVGINDGMELSRDIKNLGFNSEFNFEKVSSSARALDAFNEFKRSKDAEPNCDLEMYELITFIFDKAYEVGLFNGRYDRVT